MHQVLLLMIICLESMQFIVIRHIVRGGLPGLVLAWGNAFATVDAILINKGSSPGVEAPNEPSHHGILSNGRIHDRYSLFWYTHFLREFPEIRIRAIGAFWHFLPEGRQPIELI